MKVYLVIGYHDGDVDKLGDASERTSIFGVFSTNEKADEIMFEMEKNFEKAKEDITIRKCELTLDEPTDLYEFFKNN